MNVNNSFFHFFTDAGPMVKVVMLILLIASLISWTIIFQRSSAFKRLKKGMKVFEDTFWSGTDMSSLYSRLETQKSQDTVGLNVIFQAGFKEFLRGKQHNDNAEQNLENVQRAMYIAESRQIEKVEQYLPILATIGSTSPYIGLFGTVWGIMTSFQTLGQAQQATIAMVAPGISEALIATAMGLFAAIPAVIAYNKLSYAADKFSNGFSTFREELLSVFYRRLRQPEDAV